MKLPNPRDLVLNKDTTVSNGIKGHQQRKKNELNKKYFEIQDLEICVTNLIQEIKFLKNGEKT